MRQSGRVRIRIQGTELPGRYCGPGLDYPGGHHNIHVAIQGRKGQRDLHGLVPADVRAAAWELPCVIVKEPQDPDLRGPHIQGPPGARFIYLTWGVVDDRGTFTMFRRAKLWLDAVPAEVLAAACRHGLLVGSLGLSDGLGWPLCASVRPPRISWTAAAN
jgi:hypothetical protein